MGSRRPARDAKGGTFADAAAAGELLFNCTAGDRLAGGAGGGRRREPRRQDPGRRRQPARLLAGDAADAGGLQRRQPRRADPGGLPRGPRGEGAEHGQQRRDGRAGPGPRRPLDLRLRRRRRPPRPRSAPCSRRSAGRPSRSSTSAASRPPAAPRCTCRCGCGSTGASATPTSTSPSRAEPACRPRLVCADEREPRARARLHGRESAPSPATSRRRRAGRPPLLRHPCRPQRA